MINLIKDETKFKSQSTAQTHLCILESVINRNEITLIVMNNVKI